MENKYREGTCGYCVRQHRHLVKLECGMGHEFCCDCMINLIKITRIKKGLVDKFTHNDAVKCPECFEITIVSKAFVKEVNMLKTCQDSKDASKSNLNAHHKKSNAASGADMGPFS